MNKNNKSSAASKMSTSSPASLPSLSAKIRLMTDTSDKKVKLLGFAELTIADAFVIKGVRVLKNADDEGPFVVFPAERGKNGSSDRWFDVAHPVSAEARTAATNVILGAFRNAAETAKTAA
jgi:DNA-binding cell septation regulator SpoVG